MENYKPKYVVDTCSFTALKRIYPVDVFPGVWNFVEDLARDGIIASSEEIYRELQNVDDEILVWANSHKTIFLPLDEPIQRKVTEILSASRSLVDFRRRKSSGDPFLIATAIHHSCSIVTEEKPAGSGSPKQKIPDICKLYRISCVDLLGMLRKEGLRLDRQRQLHLF